MDLIYQWFQSNLDIVFLVYGLAFLIMGIAILVQPKEGSEIRIANILWLLALFGIAHGTSELLDMWAIIKGRDPALDSVRWFILVISYFFLFEFGRQLFRLTTPKSPAWQKKIAKPLVWWLLPVIGLFIVISGFRSFDFWKAGSIWTRYLLGFPGSLLIGFGFFSYYKHEKEILEPLRVKKYFLFVGLSFLIYGILGGIVVPRGDFFPSSWLNTDSFLLTVKIPVQVFRAICAIIAAWAVCGMLKIFNWEMTTKLKEAQTGLEQQLKESEERYKDVIENANDIVYSVDTNNFITFTNRQGYELLGYSKEEFIRVHIKEIYTPETWKEVEKGFEALKQKGSLFIDNGEMIKKSGEKLNAEIHLLAMYDGKGNYTGARSISRDVTERKRAEDAIKNHEIFLSSVLDGIEGGVAVIDRDFKIISANRGYLKHTNSTLDEIKGKHCYKVSHRLDKPCYLAGEECSVKDAFETGSSHRIIHTHFDRNDNHFYVESISYPLKDASGNVTSVVEIITDVTEKIKLDKELKKRVNDLEEFYDMAVERELKMMELKEKIKKLKEELGKYKT